MGTDWHNRWALTGGADWQHCIDGHRWVALVGTGGWHWWAQVGGTGGHRWVALLGTGGWHWWAALLGRGGMNWWVALLGTDHQGTDHQCPDDRCQSLL
ncbi:unnamed protein product [Staurois parvus]|uniref:Uncharacterized protein n=1 Tax=Staurois parvus TaxID=386267 RepID=A0ABN9B8F5_9NEOB|nr:unnamed protein product [Staurois parvus]